MRRADFLADLSAGRLGPRLAGFLGGPGLAGRIALNATALVLFVLAVGGFTSLYISASLLQERTEGELAHEAHLIAQRLEISLENLHSRLESMAGNPLTSNALTDSGSNREAYLRPYLQNDNLVRQGASLALLDSNGMVVSSAGPSIPSIAQAMVSPWFRGALEQGRTQIQLVPSKPGMPYTMRLAAPVIYPASGQAEGVLLLEVDLGGVLDLQTTPSAADVRRFVYVLSAGTVVAGQVPSLSLFEISRPLQLMALYDALGLELAVGIERWSVLQPLLKLVGSFALAGLGALAFVLWVVRKISTRLTAPLVQLADNADEIRRGGRLGMEFVYGGDDEIGRLGRSFSAMLARLGTVQNELESRVAERTRELRESEDKLSSLLRSLPDMVFSLSSDCRSFLYSSAATQRVLGIDSIGPGTPFQTFLDRVHPADLFQMYSMLLQLQDNGEAEYAFRTLRSDDELRWLNLRMHAIRDEARQLVRYDGIATDITERKLGEERVLEAELRWKLAMRGANDGLWDWDLRNDRIHFSARWKSMLGYGEHELTDHPDEWSKRIHPDDLPRVMKELVRHLKRDTEFFVSEFRMQCKDGSHKWILSRGGAMWDDAGTPLRVTGSHTDISERKRAEEALLSARRFAQSTLDGLTAHICVLDENGTILSVNEAWRQFGSNNGADLCRIAEGTNYLEVCSRETSAAAQEAGTVAEGVRSVLAGKSDLFETEYACHSPTEQRWFLVRVSRLQGEGPGRVVVAHENITPRKQAEIALRASEERWRFALEGAGDGVWDWDVQSCGLVLSKRWKEILDLAEDEVGTSLNEWEQRVHPGDKPRVMAELQKHLEGKAETYLAEYRLQGKYGWKWVLDRGMAVSRNDRGEPLRVLGTISDISRRKAVEAALQDRTEQLDTIFSLSPDGLVSFDHDGCLKFANSAFFRMTGINPDDVLNRPEQELDRYLRAIAANEDGYPGIEAYFANHGNGGGQVPMYFLNLAEPRASVLKVVGLRSRSQSVSKLLYFRDVTHETEVDRMKSEFLASAAHELRTPMASIYGFTELLLTEEFDDQTRHDVLQTIYQQTDLLVNIINELLDLARIEARRGKDFQIESLDPMQLINETTGSLQIDSDRWPLVFTTPPATPLIRGDRNKLHQALLNVIGNAVKYSPAGGAVEISVECRATRQGGEEVGFIVRDHGIGMTPDQSARVFERFYRADASGTIPGTGLGMSIVKEIVDLHGGRVEVASTLGAGTEIRLWLPATDE